MGVVGGLVGGPRPLGPGPPHPGPLPRWGEGIVGSGLVGRSRFETCPYGFEVQARMSSAAHPWSFGYFLGERWKRARPGHTPAFASLRVPFRFTKGDVCTTYETNH